MLHGYSADVSGEKSQDNDLKDAKKLHKAAEFDDSDLWGLSL